MLNKNIDRRKYPRGRADWEYLFAVEINFRRKKIISEVKDISCGGLMCKINQFFQPGKELGVAFLLPVYSKKGVKFHRIENKGLVVRCDHFPEPRDIDCHKLAVAFQGLNKKDKAFISKFVDHVRKVEKRVVKNFGKKPRLHVEQDCIISRS